jgi:fibronectin type 3 domain-containing protein
MTVAANMQITHTKVAAKAKNIATKAATVKDITTSTAAGIAMVAVAAGVVSVSSVTANYAW